MTTSAGAMRSPRGEEQDRMALLSAEDVLNKAFQKTKYREGFDQDEVDDFLDEVANTIAVLTAERDELAQRLAAVSGGDPSVAAVAVPAMASRASTQPRQAPASDAGEAPSATAMLAMAQKLHDDYVQAGEAERERLIQEGKAKAEALVGQAESDARARLNSLESEASELERRVEELRRFERDYRSHLRGYLEGLLGDLEAPAQQAPRSSAPAAQAPVPATTPFDSAGSYLDAGASLGSRRAVQSGGFDPSAPADGPRWG